MAVHIGAGLSTSPDQRAGALEAALTAREGLGGASCDLAVVFASGAHLQAPEAMLEAVLEALAPEELVGCGAGGVIGRGARSRTARPSRSGPPTSATAARSTFHATVEEVDEGRGALTGMARARRRRGHDPARRSRDVPHRRRASVPRQAAPAVPVLGGLASARTAGRRHRAVPRRPRGRRGRRWRPARRRRAAPVRVPGRRAARTGAHDHRRRRPHHPRAGGQAGAREAARDDRGAARRATSLWSRAGC